MKSNKPQEEDEGINCNFPCVCGLETELACLDHEPGNHEGEKNWKKLPETIQVNKMKTKHKLEVTNPSFCLI